MNVESDRKSFSENRDAIQNMFETPKITFGGDSICKVDQPPVSAAAKPKKSVKIDDRAWVFDAINQYFDVIVEDDEEEEEEEDAEASPMYESQVNNGRTTLIVVIVTLVTK